MSVVAGVATAAQKLDNTAKTLAWTTVLSIVIEVIAFVGKIVALAMAGDLTWATAINEVVNLVVSIVIGVYVMGALAAAFPVGTVIVVLIAIIDIVATIVCYATGANKSSTFWAQRLCEGITASVVHAIKFLIYDTTPLVDMEASDRLNFINWKTEPYDPVTRLPAPLEAGNMLRLKTEVQTKLAYSTDSLKYLTTVRGITDGSGNGTATPTQLISSTFRYEFATVAATGDAQIHKVKGLALKQMNDSWMPVGTTAYAATQPISIDLALNQAAINWHPANLFVAEGYAAPVLNCVFVIACYSSTQAKSTYINFADKLGFDVFPATLDGFYSLTDRGGGGFALAWDAKFPVLADADGDGLRSKSVGGPDPADNSADSDSDGLSDFYEVQHSNRGLDASRADSDGDGLSDYDEVRLGFSPAQADGDGDGLSDGAEQAGWLVVYGYDSLGQPQRFRVTSDPRRADTDNDGILDRQEQTYGFNPRVYNNNQVLTILSQIDERDGADDGIVADSTLIGYTASVTNTLRDRYALGLFETTANPSNLITSSTLAPRAYQLGPRSQTTLSGTLQLADLSQSQKLTLVNRAGAIIADPQALAGGRALWLRFDELQTPTGRRVLPDSVLPGNPAYCLNGGACSTVSVVDGYAGRALSLSGAQVQVEPAPALDSPTFTLSFWLKAELAHACEQCDAAE